MKTPVTLLVLVNLTRDVKPNSSEGSQTNFELPSLVFASHVACIDLG